MPVFCDPKKVPARPVKTVEQEVLKRKGWMIPGMGFIDFRSPVTFEEAKLAMEEMSKIFQAKRSHKKEQP